MQNLIADYHQIPWAALWVAVGGGSFVAVFSQLFKRVFNLNSAKVIQFLVIVFAFLVSILQWAISKSNLPASILGIHTVALLGVAQPFYLYFVKPVDKFLIQVNEYITSKKTSASTPAADAAVAAVNPPASILDDDPSQPNPLVTPEQPTANF